MLLKIADEVGLDKHALRAALEEEGRDVQKMIDNEREAHEFGISGVPLTLARQPEQALDRAMAGRGAVPYKELSAVYLRPALI